MLLSREFNNLRRFSSSGVFLARVCRKLIIVASEGVSPLSFNFKCICCGHSRKVGVANIFRARNGVTGQKMLGTTVIGSEWHS